MEFGKDFFFSMLKTHSLFIKFSQIINNLRNTTFLLNKTSITLYDVGIGYLIMIVVEYQPIREAVSGENSCSYNLY